MKSFFNLLLIMLSGSLLMAQQPAEITGQVNDEAGNPAGYSTILLIAMPDSNVAKTSLSKDDGTYVLKPLSAGTYRLSVSNAGKTFLSEPFELKAAEKKEFPVSLSPAVKQLDEVQIKARRPLVEVRPDMTVFNVEGQAIAVGENAFELLRKAPGVLIDNNDNILMAGKSGVRIYIDGKPSPLSVADLANMLKGMQSNQIESIELITNPSARYDAEGNAGIINIRLKKEKGLGTNGSLTLGYAIGSYSKYDGSLTINHRGKGYNAFGSYSGGRGYTYNFLHFYREQGGQSFDQRTIGNRDYFNNNFKGGVDFFIGKKATLGFMVNGNTTDNERVSRSTTGIALLDTREATNRLLASNTSENQQNNLNANVNFQLRGEKNSEFSADLDYGRYRIDTDSYQPNYFLAPKDPDTLFVNIFGINSPTEIDIYTLKTDYSRDAFGGKLSVGGKAAFVETDNTFDFSNVIDGQRILDEDRSNRFVYDENIFAAYSIYQRKLGKKWNAELGLRLEHTRTRGELTSVQQTGLDTVNREYTNLFPTAGLTFNPNRNHSFRLNYSRRIDRPRYQDLNPFRNQLDQFSFQEGNPFLLPQFTNSVQLTHTFKYRYTTSLSYSYTNNFFTQITDTLNQNASFLRQENLDSRQVVNLNMSAPVQLKKWWRTYTNLGLSHTQNNGDFNLPGETGKGVKVSRLTFNIYQQHTFQLNKVVALELSGFYNSPSIWGANYLTQRFWAVNTGAQFRLWDQRGILKLSVSDIFHSMQWRGIQEFGGLYFDASGGWESRQLKLNFTYNFGSNEVKRARRRKTGLEEEKGRVGGSGGIGG
ncbi:MAG: TonB-dependent receptor [Bacteroidia bacterium]